MDQQELDGRYRDLGDGDLGATCRGQGLTFHHTPLCEGWPSLSAAADALAALQSVQPSGASPAVVVCRDGRGASAGVAAAWLALHCDQAPADAVAAVEVTAERFQAGRAPLKAFEGQTEGAAGAGESFAAFLSEVSKLAGT
mmetsp:Transcript_41992/g.84666  ORF Transcript_41992/g.84666 Transcript_41992/m.84666 type:complete len:141 (+) Transcript_41992:244-666(+)